VLGKLLKLLIGLALLPLVAGEVWTLIDLARAALPSGEWSKAWAISLGAGMATWLVVFFCLPRTMWLYVLGHEFTHALAAMLAGGKISSFQVSAKGGHVITDRVNWWITLSPYFVPLYALIWSALWLSIDFWYPLKAWQPVFYFGLGLLWCFHLTFTASMMHLKQTDLSSQGFVFSFAVIAAINLLMFLVVSALLAHGVAFSESAQHLLNRVELAYVIAGREIARGATWLWSLWH
jgi:hypothetical protein